MSGLGSRSSPRTRPRLGKLLQFSLVVAIIGVLAAGLLNKLSQIQEKSEKVLVETTIQNVSSGLRSATADFMFHGQDARIKELVGTNPVLWLQKPPDGYLGECPATSGGPGPGVWCFDAGSRELRYWPKLDRNLKFQGASGGLRWRIDAAGSDPRGSGRVDWVEIVLLTPYIWF